MLILEQILAHKREEVAEAKRAHPRQELAREAQLASPPRNFRAAIRRSPGSPAPRFIAEIKRASPSRGVLAASLDPAALAIAYERAGARALSVLTDGRFFGGSLADLRRARRACGLPVLRKDFLIDPYQIVEARASEADAVLVIASSFGPAAGGERLPGALLADLIGEARELGLTPLVEIHDRADLDRALAADADVIGINNRDLTTFVVDLNVTVGLAPLIPSDRLVVSESGFRRRQDVAIVAGLKVDALLVGESLVTSGDIGAKIRELSGEECV